MVYRIVIIVFLFLYLNIFIACRGKEKESFQAELFSTAVAVNYDLIIGHPDQSTDSQLGEPIAVRTNEKGQIFVADRASMQIKVYDEWGNFQQNIGGRGRGPGEFHEMEFMELNSDGDLVLMDRVNLRFLVINTDGEEINSFPYNLDDQIYPQSIKYIDEEIIALFFDSSSFLQTPVLDRHLFHVLSPDFQTRYSSFMPINHLGYKEVFPALSMAYHPGSFTLHENKHILIYSPSIYTGILYIYKKTDENKWVFDKTILGKEPIQNPFVIYNSELQYKRALDSGEARAQQVRWGGEMYHGTQYSMDAGIYFLDDGRILHFYAEWKEGYERLSDSMSHPMDLYVQVFSEEGDLTHHKNIFTFIERFIVPFHSVVNWKDEKNRFYLLEQPDDIPIIRRFSLEIG